MYFRINLESILPRCQWEDLMFIVNLKEGMSKNRFKITSNSFCFWETTRRVLKTVYKAAVADPLKEWSGCMILFKSTVNWEKSLSNVNCPLFLFFCSVTFPMVEMGCWLQVPMDLSTVAPELKHQFLTLGMMMMTMMILMKMMMTTDALCL